MIEAEALDDPELKRPAKSDAAFRTISEVSEELDVPQHVLRFWESKFSLIRPLKRGGGRRYYRPEDVLLLRRIRDLLYKDGYTIRGVQKLLKENPKAVSAPKESDTASPAELPNEVVSAAPSLPIQPDLLDYSAGEPLADEEGRDELSELLHALIEMRQILTQALGAAEKS